MPASDTAARETDAKDCPVCKGTGEVSRTVLVGRKRRAVGKQTGFCLNCLGSGEAPAE
jgi:DnaJ-class molecular chaperone